MREKSDSGEIERFDRGVPTRKRDLVAVEEPLEIRVDGQPLAVLMRSPGEDAELALGLLLSEAIIMSSNDVEDVVACAADGEDNVVDVRLKTHVDRKSKARALVTSSSCGLCGKQTISDVLAHARGFDAWPSAGLERVSELAESLRSFQANFTATGALHAAAVFDAEGRKIVVREDIGRHNAVDKCSGALLLNELLPVEDATLVVSGRASFEIVQKALAGRFQTIVAISAPSSLAVELAQRSKIRLVGFCRGKAFNLYTR